MHIFGFYVGRLPFEPEAVVELIAAAKAVTVQAWNDEQAQAVDRFYRAITAATEGASHAD